MIMGLLRFCLALSIVAIHTRQLFPFKLIGSFYALKVFFVISGFFLALILNEKYLLKKDSYKLFITNRILRIYPLYLIVFFMSLIMYILCAKLPPSPPDHFKIVLSN